MQLQRISQLKITLPIILFLGITSISGFFYLNTIMTDNAQEKGLLVVDMVRTAILSNITEEGHSLNSSDIMQHFRSLPGLREVRLIRSDAINGQFGPSQSDSEPQDEIERKMLSSGKKAQSIESIDGHEVLHFNGPLKAGNNCLQCHQVSPGTVLGGLSVQVDISDELKEALMVSLISLIIIAFCGLFVAYALRRFSAPISNTAIQISEAMVRGEKGDFTRRLQDIRADSDEIRQIIESSNGFLGALQHHIGGIAREVELITGYHPKELQSNMIARARQSVDLMLYATKLKRALEDDRDLDEAFERMSYVLQHDFALDRFGIFESMDDTHSLKPVVMVGLPEGWNSWCDQPQDGDASACRATRTGHAVDVSEDSDACRLRCGHYNDNSSLKHLCIPINESGGTRTLITILYEIEKAEMMANTLARLRYVIRAVTPELRSKRLLKILRDTSIHDGLTGMFNRRFLEEVQSSLVASVQRRNTTLGVLMCDIDHFKMVNDTYGHETGDVVLKGIADIFTHMMRESDYVIRFGGEEILVLLMDADKLKSAEIAERIRSRIAARKFKSAQGEFTKTVSIGVALFPEDSSNLHDAIQYADEALYTAKNSGRNQVVMHAGKATEPEPSSDKIIRISKADA
ncbi:MAG: diguanylate cyclase [Mariprofundaceae bacterium]|nr:diguanylate cyclase [Mariprofundaceae bacterium]